MWLGVNEISSIINYLLNYGIPDMGLQLKFVGFKYFCLDELFIYGIIGGFLFHL